MSEHPFVPFSLPSIDDAEIGEVVDTLRSGWLTTGPRTARFESEFAEYVGAPNALAVNSATSGLHLALAALGLGPGDEVITTPLTFCATVNTIMHVGATPVLADVGPDGNLDPSSVAARITERTRAIVPVHLGGLPCRMDVIWDMAERHGLHVVEDAAHAVGAHYRGYPIGAGYPAGGARSAAVVFSFYATKNLTTGEGGMVTTHDEALAARMRNLCLHGISKDAWNRYAEQGNWYYEVTSCGFKYNLSDLQSAIGIHQLRKQEAFVAARARLARLYEQELAEVAEIELPHDSPRCRHAWHLYAIRLQLERLRVDRDEFMRLLRLRNIGASVHFIPIQLHPYFAAHARLPQNQCPESLTLYRRLVSLPLYPALADEDLRYVARSVKQIVLETRRSARVTVPQPARLRA
jgi:dTDP-4-amino-4,6-dideoxygalactose transaminase